MTSVIQQFFKNVFTIYLGIVIGMVITFFFTPFLIGILGKSQYGVWQLAFSILAYMGLADIGMKQSIVRYISKYYATGDWRQLNAVFSSSVRLYLIIATAILVATAVISFGVLQHFELPPELVNVARYTFLLLGLDQVISYLFIPFTALGAFHRFDLSNWFRIGKQVVQTLGIVILLKAGQGLVAMAVMVLIVNLLVQLGMNLIRARKYPQMHFSRDLINREQTKELLHYGVYSFLLVVTWIVIFQSDNIIIGWFISAEAVAVYSVAAALVNQVRSSIGVLTTPLVPAISHFEAEKDFDKIRRLYARATRYLYYLSGYLAIMTVLFGGPFILLWVGPEFAESILIIQILILSSAIHLPQSIAASVLLGISKHKIAFYIQGAEALSKIILSVILVHSLGIVGVAVASAVPQVLIYSFIYPYVFHRAIEADVRKFYFTAGRSLLLSVVVLLPVAWVVRHVKPPDTWLALIVE
ncbi:MAG TPA: oligosaccharide flippase family protein, partial [Candidatus Deferrimicrobium sp.]|nr:oligosaccharide flippase family protein [Candidatus Deferrimicrobium sp.]